MVFATADSFEDGPLWQGVDPDRAVCILLRRPQSQLAVGRGPEGIGLTTSGKGDGVVTATGNTGNL